MLEMLPDTAEYLIKKGTHDNHEKSLELYGEMREWAQEAEHRKHRRKHANAKAAHGQNLPRHSAGGR